MTDSVKTFNGVAVASVKTYQGIAKAGVKSVNGVSLAAVSTDPHFANVVLLVGNDNAADGSTTFTDQSSAAHAITAVGNIQYDTAQAPTGMTSSILLDGTGDRLEVADSTDWYFPGLVTLETWVRRNGSFGSSMFITQSPGGTGTAWQWFFEPGTMYLSRDTGSPNRAAGWSPSGNTWYAIAVEWNGTNTSFYVDGTRIGQDAGGVFGLDLAQKLTVGARGDGVYTLNGWQGPTRITKGVARMNGAASYTVPTLPLPTQ